MRRSSAHIQQCSAVRSWQRQTEIYTCVHFILYSLQYTSSVHIQQYSTFMVEVDQNIHMCTLYSTDVVYISNNVVQYVHGRGRLKYIHVYTLQYGSSVHIQQYSTFMVEVMKYTHVYTLQYRSSVHIQQYSTFMVELDQNIHMCTLYSTEVVYISNNILQYVHGRGRLKCIWHFCCYRTVQECRVKAKYVLIILNKFTPKSQFFMECFYLNPHLSPNFRASKSETEASEMFLIFCS